MARDEESDFPAGIATVPITERHFYGKTKAFGRFGVRQFAPQLMPEAHWHGHIEFNFCHAGLLVYEVDGRSIEVPADRLCVFWAGVPHRLARIDPVGSDTPLLTNIYLPVDTFLAMPHLTGLQFALLSGAMALVPEGLGDLARVSGWYRDYRSGNAERAAIVRSELHAMMRRQQLEPAEWLREPLHRPDASQGLSLSHMRHVIEMLRYIIENLANPMTNAEITAVTGLHENYALTLFTRSMRMPPKKFVTRLRVLRARGLLTESNEAISTIATRCGFSSISQFYHHFKAAYGLPPNAARGA